MTSAEASQSWTFDQTRPGYLGISAATGKDGGGEMEASSSAGATLAPAQVAWRATDGGTLAPTDVAPHAPKAQESQGQIALLLLGGTLLLYSAVGFGLYEFFTFAF